MNSQPERTANILPPLVSQWWRHQMLVVFSGWVILYSCNNFHPEQFNVALTYSVTIFERKTTVGALSGSSNINCSSVIILGVCYLLKPVSSTVKSYGANCVFLTSIWVQEHRITVHLYLNRLENTYICFAGLGLEKHCFSVATP